MIALVHHASFNPDHRLRHKLENLVRCVRIGSLGERDASFELACLLPNGGFGHIWFEHLPDHDLIQCLISENGKQRLRVLAIAERTTRQAIAVLKIQKHKRKISKTELHDITQDWLEALTRAELARINKPLNDLRDEVRSMLYRLRKYRFQVGIGGSHDRA